MTTNHASLVGAVGVVTSTGARVPGDMRVHLPSHVGELSPLGFSRIQTSARLETRPSVYSPVHTTLAQSLESSLKSSL